MERGVRSHLGTVLKGMLIAGGLVVAARIYLALVPHSAALGAVMVIAAGGILAFAVLHIDRRIEELRAEAKAEAPPGP